jgi:hypothetical protein
VRVSIQLEEEELKIGANGYGAAGPYREIRPYGRENDLFRLGHTDDAPILVEIQLSVEEPSTTA